MAIDERLTATPNVSRPEPSTNQAVSSLPASNQNGAQNPPSPATTSGDQKTALVKLPKLEVRKFSDRRKVPVILTANALFAKKGEVKGCAFCLGNHTPENCTKVTDIGERKKLLIRLGRCFNCIDRDHRARDPAQHKLRAPEPCRRSEVLYHNV